MHSLLPSSDREIINKLFKEEFDKPKKKKEWQFFCLGRAAEHLKANEDLFEVYPYYLPKSLFLDALQIVLLERLQEPKLEVKKQMQKLENNSNHPDNEKFSEYPSFVEFLTSINPSMEEENLLKAYIKSSSSIACKSGEIFYINPEIIGEILNANVPTLKKQLLPQLFELPEGHGVGMFSYKNIKKRPTSSASSTRQKKDRKKRSLPPPGVVVMENDSERVVMNRPDSSQGVRKPVFFRSAAQLN